MLKDLLQQTYAKRVQDDHFMIESTQAGNDDEIEKILPIIASGPSEYEDYRIILGQLKKRNPKAYKKIVNLE